MVGTSEAVRARVRWMWDELEDQLTAALTRDGDDARTSAGHRLEASLVVALVRSTTTVELRDLVAGASTPAARSAATKARIRSAAARLQP